MIKAVIIEDEDFAVSRLKMLLEETPEPVEVIAVLDGIQKAVQWLSMHTADLIFMDINLSDGNAFKIFEQVDIKVPIIFTTAYHEYALRAFEQHSIDYLLKPISREKVHKSLAKLKALQSSSIQGGETLKTLVDMMQEQAKPKRFMVQIGSKIKVVEAKEVAYFVFHSKITFLCTIAGKRYPIDSSLKQLGQSLPIGDFFRVNRQYLLNRQAIEELHYYSPTRVKVQLQPKTEGEIIVAREKLGLFKKWLAGD